jgi:hypothetical protein
MTKLWPGQDFQTHTQTHAQTVFFHHIQTLNKNAADNTFDFLSCKSNSAPSVCQGQGKKSANMTEVYMQNI